MTVTVDCLELPGRRNIPVGEAWRVKLDGFTMSVRVADELSEPEVPVMVRVVVPGVAALLAERVM